MKDFKINIENDEIEIVGSPNENEEILSDVNIYDKINSPIAFVLAKKGFYYKIDATHNLPMTGPKKIKEIIIKFLGKK